MVRAVLVVTSHAKQVMRAVRCIPTPSVTGFELPSTSHINPEEYHSTMDGGTCSFYRGSGYWWSELILVWLGQQLNHGCLVWPYG